MRQPQNRHLGISHYVHILHSNAYYTQRLTENWVCWMCDMLPIPKNLPVYWGAQRRVCVWQRAVARRGTLYVVSVLRSLELLQLGPMEFPLQYMARGRFIWYKSP